MRSIQNAIMWMTPARARCHLLWKPYPPSEPADQPMPWPINRPPLSTAHTQKTLKHSHKYTCTHRHTQIRYCRKTNNHLRCGRSSVADPRRYRRPLSSRLKKVYPPSPSRTSRDRLGRCSPPSTATLPMTTMTTTAVLGLPLRRRSQWKPCSR